MSPATAKTNDKEEMPLFASDQRRLNIQSAKTVCKACSQILRK
jgi:hypothetical protein